MISCELCIVCNTKLTGKQTKYCSSRCKWKFVRDSGYYAKRREKNKRKAIDYLGGKCVECSRVYPIKCYEFHHINPDEKEYRIGMILRYSWDVIKKELDKCILVCGNCHMEMHYDYNDDNTRKRHSHKYKKRAVNYLGGKCIDCGYNKHYAALCFHHKDGEEKEFQIGTNLDLSWDTIQIELDKCVLYCINCHRIKHNS
jgi:hypothetical protein